MPCYDAEDLATRTLTVYQDTEQTLRELAETKNKLTWTEAALCAIISNHEATMGEKVTNEMLHQCGIDGSIQGLKSWWNEHKKNDIIRLKKILSDNPMIEVLFNSIMDLGGSGTSNITKDVLINVITQMLPGRVSRQEAAQVYLLLLNK